MTQPKVDNKWVEKKMREFDTTLGDSAVVVAFRDFVKCDEGRRWVEELISQTQQETLEWCLEVVKQRKLAKDPVGEIVKTIKKKMGGKDEV